MKRVMWLSIVFVLVVAAFPRAQTLIPRDSSLYVEDSDMQTAIIAAIIKKKVPVKLVTNKELAEFTLAATTAAESEGTGERITKVIMLGAFAGSGKSRDTSVTVVDREGTVRFAYNTRKVNVQSAAEGIAKNLKKAIAKR